MANGQEIRKKKTEPIMQLQIPDIFAIPCHGVIHSYMQRNIPPPSSSRGP
jgi:hypothetical protein